MMRTPYHLFINKVTIKRAIPALDAGQGPTETFVNFLVDQPAKVSFSVGSENPFEYGRSAPQSFGTAIMAPNLGVVTNMRIVFQGEEYNITAVRDTSERDVITRVDFDRVQ
jgi:hypothetical protein